MYNHGDIDRLHLVIDMKVNEWLKELFLKERIIERGEQAPDPMDSYPTEVKKEIVQHLMQQGTETSIKTAQEIMKKYSLAI